MPRNLGSRAKAPLSSSSFCECDAPKNEKKKIISQECGFIVHCFAESVCTKLPSANEVGNLDKPHDDAEEGEVGNGGGTQDFLAIRNECVKGIGDDEMVVQNSQISPLSQIWVGHADRVSSNRLRDADSTKPCRHRHQPEVTSKRRIFLHGDQILQ